MQTSLELIHPTKVHPRTGEPLRALAIRPNGEPLWPMMGGDGSESDANDTGDGDTGEGNDATGDQTDDQNAGDGQDDDNRVARANRQAANYRGQLRQAEQERDEARQQHEQTTEVLERLRRAITGDEGDGDGDPAEQVTELTSRVESLSTENATLRAELLVHNLAGEHNANASALLDSRGFLNTLQGLDPEGENYRTEVADAIKDAVSKNTAYRAGQGSSRGGGELDGQQREQRRQRPAGGLAGAIGSAMNRG